MLVLREEDHTFLLQNPQAYLFQGFICLTAFSRQKTLFPILKEDFLPYNLRQDRRACVGSFTWEVCLYKESMVEPITSIGTVLLMGNWPIRWVCVCQHVGIWDSLGYQKWY